MPHRDVVRSLILPKTGLLTNATSAPTPVTRASLLGARSLPTSESTFSANVTSNGATRTREVLTYASAYREMNPGPTDGGTEGSRSPAGGRGRGMWMLTT